jgi:hypothetical protein
MSGRPDQQFTLDALAMAVTSAAWRSNVGSVTLNLVSM